MPERSAGDLHAGQQVAVGMEAERRVEAADAGQVGGVEEALRGQHRVERRRSVALGQQEPIAVRIRGGRRGDPQHPIVEHPEHIEGGGRGRGVLLVAGHRRHQRSQIVVRVVAGHCHTSSVQLQVHLKSSDMLGDVTDAPPALTIGELARRSGVAASALRYYETHRPDPRRAHQRWPAALPARDAPAGGVRAGRSAGRALAGRGARRDGAAAGRPRTGRDRVVARRAGLATRIDHEIAQLQNLRRNLTGCIGCGCLSLRTCRIYNPDDAAAERGAGARYLLGDSADDFRAPRSGAAGEG